MTFCMSIMLSNNCFFVSLHQGFSGELRQLLLYERGGLDESYTFIYKSQVLNNKNKT